ncbi:2-keto-4-pentenoate hydratase [Arthrobacter sp. HMWF013]|uniref:2-keto-4-pentenoate hydratase n=1 Tax=Arthrobacter sp. HMWF013 TaxID=2056849 RepID=UPI000D3B6334|nr:fumarylacetoacetate hydrolase family protein [Arthrobacter sp. HMWF013]PTT63109.1 2-keto-4-pentenoate hydratase [Arthrobacter sp. HMWF013]
MSAPQVQTAAVTSEDLDLAVFRLEEAERTRVAGSPVRDLLGAFNVKDAYTVQQRIIAAKITGGARQVGRKIGLTSPAVQEQVGVDTPDFGVLLDDMAYSDGAYIPIERLIAPRAEAEIAIVLAHDITDPDVSLEDVARAVAYASPAIEVVDSRIANWDIQISDTVADNASSGVFVLGNAKLSLSDFVPRESEMLMTSDGVEVSTGTGAACLGDPLEALRWLARTSIGFGAPLRAGEVILSGALGPLAPVEAGKTLTASITGLGAVTVTFTQRGIQ